MPRKIKLLAVLLFFLSCNGFANIESLNIENDDLNLGSTDIFNDFNEDYENTKVLEDENFYQYARFYNVSLSLGHTMFDGNRGSAYVNEPPTLGISLNYFINFRTSMGIGWAYSQHHFFIDQAVNGYNPDPPGAIAVRCLRFFINYRHYLDTSNLGTAITYANPYFALSMEYWYITNRFIDQSQLENEKGGGFGFGYGGGLEFPIKLRDTYLGVEFLIHSINFHDKYTQKYRALVTGTGFGYSDMSGTGYTTKVSYIFGW